MRRSLRNPIRSASRPREKKGAKSAGRQRKSSFAEKHCAAQSVKRVRTKQHYTIIVLLLLYFRSSSGAGTNLKVGGPGPERKWVVPLHFFGTKSTIIRFGERFRDGQYSLVSFLFAVLLTVPPPRAPWSRRHCIAA